MTHGPTRTGFPWKTAIFVTPLLLVILALLWFADRRAGEAVALLEGFREGKITTTFIQDLPMLTREPVLEVAVLKAAHTLRREDASSALWGMLPLGTTVSEIRVPATFRYHIPLAGEWRIHQDMHHCRVIAPAIRASNPPAIHTDEMEKFTQSGWARFNAQDNLDALEKDLTPRLVKIADNSIPLVRESCRASVRDFVKGWLERQGQWRRDGFTSIEVRFLDEPETGASPGVILP